MIVILFKHSHTYEENCPGREGDIRLAGGTSLSGRVEVCMDGTWGTVCDDFWGCEEASVACFQLGLSRTSEFLTQEWYSHVFLSSDTQCD